MKIRRSIILVGIALSALTLPLRAHHSNVGEFNTKSKAVSLTGTITRIELRNPHSSFYLDVKDVTTGQVHNWKIEYGGGWLWTAGSVVPPGIVTRNTGITATSGVMNGAMTIDEKATFGVLKVGELVTLKGLQSADGTFWVVFMTLMDEQGKSIIG